MLNTKLAVTQETLDHRDELMTTAAIAIATYTEFVQDELPAVLARVAFGVAAKGRC